MIKIMGFDLDNTLFDTEKNILYNGIENLLKSIQDKYILILITNKNKKEQINKLNNIEELFKEIYYLGDINRLKPDPYIFKKILKKYNIHSKEFVYIGNNPYTDFIPCKIIGGRSIRVLTKKYLETKVDISIDGDVLCKNVFHAINHVVKYF